MWHMCGEQSENGVYCEMLHGKAVNDYAEKQRHLKK